MKYKNIREEELKNKVGADWFKQFDTTDNNRKYRLYRFSKTTLPPLWGGLGWGSRLHKQCLRLGIFSWLQGVQAQQIELSPMAKA